MGTHYRSQRFDGLKIRIQRLLGALFVGVLGTIAVLGLWQQLTITERLHVEQLMQQQITLIETELEKDLNAHVSVLERMAKRWNAAGGTDKNVWDISVASIIEDFPGMQAIAWVNSSFQVQWVVPQAAHTLFQNSNLSQVAQYQSLLSKAHNLRQPLLTPEISFSNGERGFLALVPLFIPTQIGRTASEQFDGFIVGILFSESLFESTLHPSSQYQIQIFDETGLIYQSGELLPSDLSSQVPLQAYGREWQVQVAPTSSVLDEESLLPLLVLGGGLASVWTLAFAIYLGQRSQRFAQKAKTINHYLQQEIAERHHIEVELRDLSDRLELAVQSAQIGIWDWDIPDDRLLWNDQMYAIYGLAPSYCPGVYEDWVKALHPDDRDLATTAIQQALRGEQDYAPEFRIIHPNGTIRVIQAYATVQRDSQGQAQRMIGVNLDISDRKKAEAALEKELLQSKALMRTSIDGIVVLNSKGDAIQSSASFARMLGYTLKETLTLNVTDWDSQWTREELSRVFTGDVVLPPVFETRHRRKDGSTYDTEISYSQVELDNETLYFCICRDISDRKRVEHDRKRTEMALQASQARFAGILELASDAIISVNADQRIILFNERAEQIFGYKVEEVLGKPLSLLMPDQFVQNHSLHVEYYGQSSPTTRQMAQRGDVLGRRKNGTKFPAEASISKLNIDGELTFTTFLRDISDRVQLETERQQAEQALRESEARFQAFMNHSPAVAWITDRNGTMLYSSKTYLQTFPLPTDNLIGKSVLDLFPPELAQQYVTNIQKVVQTQQVLEAIEIAPRRDGTTGSFLVYKFPIPDSSGQILVGGVAIDITQQHQAEEALRHQKEMFQAIVDHIPVMIALFNAEGRINFINPEFERTLGWSLDEWQQRDVLVDCYPDPIYRQKVLDHMTAALGNWRDFTTQTETHQEIETSWVNIRLSDGRHLGIGQDVSDRKRKEIALRQAMEAAEAANLAKSMFLANMSHELRTPLNVILGFAQVMSHDTSLTPSQQEDLQTIRRSGDYLLSLINDVLDLSKIEAGHCTLEERGFDLLSLLHTLRTMMAERARAKQLQLTFDIDPNMPQFITADEQKLRQILLNLLSNAIKFTSEGSVTLRVSAERTIKAAEVEEGTQNGLHPTSIDLRFELEDTGVGIAPQELETIFDAFAQAEAGRKSISGTGLGLTISRKLLELMNGRIGAQSTPGIGSTFTVTIPVCATTGVNVQPEQSDRTIIGLAPGQRHRRILVVDDQPENRRLMVRLLTHLGLAVREAADGCEAVQIWQKWQPDLTWMDIRMPGIDGYEATKQIRAMEQDKASIIIALTAQASQGDRTLAIAAGCNDYISKPFQEETVFLKMAEYLGLKYTYADSSPLLKGTPSLELTPSLSTSTDQALQSLPDLSALPSEWLGHLEEASVCCDDHTVIHLSEQLPPEFAQLGTYLIERAHHFQFEQILNLLQSISSA